MYLEIIFGIIIVGDEWGRIWKNAVVAHFTVSKQSMKHFSQTSIDGLTHKVIPCSTAHQTYLL
jgi:hypothetical protein